MRDGKFLCTEACIDGHTYGIGCAVGKTVTVFNNRGDEPAEGCGDICFTNGYHTFESGVCMLRRVEDLPEGVHALAVITPQTGPVCSCGFAWNMKQNCCESQTFSVTEVDPRDLLAEAVPGYAFHDEDVTGETWTWTTPKGSYRLMMSHLPESAVIVEFKQPRQRQERVQSVVTVKKPSAKDIRDFIIPIIDPA